MGEAARKSWLPPRAGAALAPPGRGLHRRNGNSQQSVPDHCLSTVMKISTVMFAVSLAGFSLGCGSKPPAPVERLPNVVLIMTDDQGWGDVGVHGNTLIKTPVLDRLAEESVEFTRFHVSPVCAPTRASLLTGRYHLRCGTHGVTGGRETMFAEETTIAEALKAAGYRTGIFGKWHLGEHYPYVPQAQGFDEFVGFRTGHWTDYFDTPLEHNGRPIETQGYIADYLTGQAIGFIEGSGEKPFFLYLPYNPPHSPFQVPDRYYDLYQGQGLDERTRSVYAMVSNLDDNIGRILAKLEERGLADDTIVIFLGDNGPNTERYNGGLRGRKGSVYEGGTRVPFFIRWPRGFAGGRKAGVIAAHIDLYPTLLELCGVKPLAGKPLDGVSLAPLLQGRAQDWPERKLYTHRERMPDPASRYPGAVRTQRYNLVNGEELYDLETDPGEQHNVAAEQPEVVEELRAAYEAWYGEVSGEGAFPRLPIPVGYAEENPVSLPAPQAHLEGSVHFATGPGWAHDWIKGWTELASRVSWNIDVVEGGRYAVALRYLCPAHDVGSKVHLTVGDFGMEAEIREATSMEPRRHPDRAARIEAPEMSWKTLPMGDIELPKGQQTLTIEAHTKPGKTVMELQKVVLTKLD